MLIGTSCASLSEHRDVLLVPVVAYAFTERQRQRQRQDLCSPVGAVDWAATEDVGGFPEVGFEFGKAYGRVRCRRQSSCRV